MYIHDIDAENSKCALLAPSLYPYSTCNGKLDYAVLLIKTNIVRWRTIRKVPYSGSTTMILEGIGNAGVKSMACYGVTC
jgi:hypothetical protein